MSSLLGFVGLQEIYWLILVVAILYGIPRVKRAAFPLAEKKLQDRVDRVAGGLCKRAQKVRVVRSREPNAYALPGDIIVITDRLVEFCATDDELAFVIGHETSHLVLTHARDRFWLDCVARLFVCSPVASLARRLVQCAYSQDQELEADRRAARTIVKAGFRGNDAKRLLKKLHNLPGKNPGYFGSHPPLEVRLDTIDDELRALRP